MGRAEVQRPLRLLATVAAAGLVASGCAEPAGRIEQLDGSHVSVREIEAAIPKIMAAARLPGLQVAVISDGRVAYANGFGVRSTESPEPVTERTVFAALSFSKTIFAYLVMQLVDDGLLDLDRPLAAYLSKPLPEYEFYRDLEGERRVAALTARMALSHTTGLPNWRWFTPEGTLHFVYEPGERFSYSGEGIYLLQLVVEEVTQSSIEELARARIFAPLGMDRTSYLFLPEFEDDYAVDHDRFLAPIGKERRDEANAAGSAQTTATDFAGFLAAVMAGEGLSSASRQELWSPQVPIEHVRMFGPLSRAPIAPDTASPTSWGLGWGLVETEHGRALFHTGNDAGAANYHVAFPDRGIGVVLLGNSQTLESAAPALTRLLIGDRYSPFGFLGYEPYDSPRHRLAEAFATSGLQAGLEQYASLSEKEVALWHEDEWGLLDGVGRELIGLGRLEEAAEFYQHFLQQHPERLSGYNHLAAAHVAMGDWEAARQAYRNGLERSAADPEWEGRFRWRLEWAGALSDPATLPAGLLQEYAGEYGERHVEVRDGALYYLRKGASVQRPRRLYAISEDTFVLEQENSVKLRFERGPDGSVVGITGLYLDGQTDESPRDPEPET